METRPFQVCLICNFCSSDRGFASDFFQTPHHDGRPCLWLTVPTAKPVADFHRQVITHAEHTKETGHPLRYSLYQNWCPVMVPVVGLEPTRYRYQRILSPSRLPIPSHRRLPNDYIIIGSVCQDNFFTFYCISLKSKIQFYYSSDGFSIISSASFRICGAIFSLCFFVICT